MWCANAQLGYYLPLVDPTTSTRPNASVLVCRECPVGGYCGEPGTEWATMQVIAY